VPVGARGGRSSFRFKLGQPGLAGPVMCQWPLTGTARTESQDTASHGLKSTPVSGPGAAGGAATVAIAWGQASAREGTTPPPPSRAAVLSMSEKASKPRP
jgi:hypothetical protein